ncbi:GntR family transcriptional regulator [Nonomuraea sp. NPDC050536]|uniref:GntR family transcriptional regulator n=1 Tax=Nonomuraea sp. NPDC050536 TaxID=3364366 RepID=UPI0037CB6C2D
MSSDLTFARHRVVRSAVVPRAVHDDGRNAGPPSTWKGLNLVSRVADYRRIADSLRSWIATGGYPPGSMLPSESRLCKEFGVARTTVRRALTLLEGEGIILAVPAKGRVVQGGPTTPHYRYQAIADDLRGQILRDELPAGATLPSEATLCRRYAVSRNTIRQALGILERDGLVAVRQGSGRIITL